MPPRRDGRRNEETRPLSLTFESLARVDGSARFSFGNTSALASVSGPIEVRLAAEHPSEATFEVAVRPLSNVPATESKAIASAIRATLEPSLILTKNPRSLVQLVVQALSPSAKHTWNTTLAAAMINACSLALLNASSVPMRGVVAAVAVCHSITGTILVDPSDDELVDVKSCGCFAFIFADQVGVDDSRSDCVWTSWKSSGGLDEAEILKAKEMAQRSAQTIYRALRKAVANACGLEVDESMTPEEGKSESEESEDKMII
ncbi:ribosomal protein S5 domain 2-type protein [Crepidotus variabilis]|uniref:Ribosomal protein S5 domain 2-type protein n=1 Tax=Crepidotus variabilis TaxID=179855 RepID=A0A9P6JI23_9AGAR|nr:ribosomal protein S5 domain 2-type protein [Crepidotus variabilis]